MWQTPTNIPYESNHMGFLSILMCVYVRARAHMDARDGFKILLTVGKHSATKLYLEAPPPIYFSWLIHTENCIV